MTNNSSKNIVIHPRMKIGYVDAIEDSELLDNCFIDTDLYPRAVKTGSPECIVLGRTGTGKTAIIQKIIKDEENVIEIDPVDLSLNYISNSTIIKFYSGIGVDLNLFFQMLWKHVLVSSLLMFKYNVQDKREAKNIFEKIFESSRYKRSKKLALDYLEEWGDSFWLETEEQIKEVVRQFETSLESEVGLSIEKIKSQITGKSSLSEEQKIEILHKAQNVVNNLQLKQLSKLMDVMAEDIFHDHQQKNFVVIDKLDENWVDDDLRLKLVRALIETQKAFRKIRNVKIIIALRFDLLERVFKYTQDSGFQREKYEDFILPISWNSQDLIKIVDARINYIYKSKYTKDDVTFSDIFPKNIKGSKGNNRSKQNIETYLTYRTQFRPRDIISFVNTIFEKAHLSSKITEKTISDAEKIYSQKRLQALFDEWKAEHPYLACYVDLIRNMPIRFKVSEISNSKLDDCILEMAAKDHSPDGLDDLAKGTYHHTSSPYEKRIFLNSLIAILYKTGVVGVTLRKGEKVIYSYQQPYDLDPNEITEDSFLTVSPMFHSTLKAAPNKGGELVGD